MKPDNNPLFDCVLLSTCPTTVRLITKLNRWNNLLSDFINHRSQEPLKAHDIVIGYYHENVLWL